MKNQKNIFSNIVGGVYRAIGGIGKYDGRNRRLWDDEYDGRLGNWLGQFLVFDNVFGRAGLGGCGRSSGNLANQTNRQEVKIKFKNKCMKIGA